jgi:hypothetical protein
MFGSVNVLLFPTQSIYQYFYLKYTFIKEPKIEFNFTVESVSEFYMVVSESVLFLRARGMLDKY